MLVTLAAWLTFGTTPGMTSGSPLPVGSGASAVSLARLVAARPRGSAAAMTSIQVDICCRQTTYSTTI
jgi:hypothetical protein